MPSLLTRSIAAILLLLAAPNMLRAEMRGHGGPVRALLVLPGGERALSGSFDHSAILWDLGRGAALAVLRFHNGAVNALAALPDGRFATGGEDGRVAVWEIGQDVPLRHVQPHTGPIVSLALSPDGARLLSASWDGTAGLINLESGDTRNLEGHTGPVNAVAFIADGRAASAGYDGTVRIWPVGHPGAPVVVAGAGPVNALSAAGDDRILTGGADGVVRLLNADGSVQKEAELGGGPIAAIAVSHETDSVAVAALGGPVTILDGSLGRTIVRLVGPRPPVWSVAFLPGGRELLTGGGDGTVRRWDLRTGQQIGPIKAASLGPDPGLVGDERGRKVFEACSACHALTPDGGNRAGPTLHGVFGRRIGTLPGYPFSDALKNMDIVWTAETIGELFEIGPSRYTPGTKMPEQIVAGGDREALVRFLETATQPGR